MYTTSDPDWTGGESKGDRLYDGYSTVTFACVVPGDVSTSLSAEVSCLEQQQGTLAMCYREQVQTQRQRTSGKDCLLTRELLTRYLALHSHTPPYSSHLLLTALLEANQLRVRPRSHAQQYFPRSQWNRGGC